MQQNVKRSIKGEVEWGRVIPESPGRWETGTDNGRDGPRHMGLERTTAESDGSDA